MKYITIWKLTLFCMSSINDCAGPPVFPYTLGDMYKTEQECIDSAIKNGKAWFVGQNKAILEYSCKPIQIIDHSDSEGFLPKRRQ